MRHDFRLALFVFHLCFRPSHQHSLQPEAMTCLPLDPGSHNCNCGWSINKLSLSSDVSLLLKAISLTASNGEEHDLLSRVQQTQAHPRMRKPNISCLPLHWIFEDVKSRYFFASLPIGRRLDWGSRWIRMNKAPHCKRMSSIEVALPSS